MRKLLAGMPPRSGVSQVPRTLPVAFRFYVSDRMIQTQPLKKGGQKLCGFYG